MMWRVANADQSTPPVYIATPAPIEPIIVDGDVAEVPGDGRELRTSSNRAADLKNQFRRQPESCSKTTAAGKISAEGRFATKLRRQQRLQMTVTPPSLMLIARGRRSAWANNTRPRRLFPLTIQNED